MIFKVGQYRNGKAGFIRHIQRNGVDTLSFYCACVGFPVAAAVIFVKEEFPEHTEEMDRKLGVLKEFYGYEDFEE
jgi:hypothetical protein